MAILAAGNNCLQSLGIWWEDVSHIHVRQVAPDISFFTGPSHWHRRWAAMEGGGAPRKNSNLEANCKAFLGIWCHVSVHVTTRKDFLILQQTKKTLRSGTRILHYPPLGTKFKNWSQLQAFPGIWCPFRVTAMKAFLILEQTTIGDKDSLRWAAFIVLCCSVLQKNNKRPKKWGGRPAVTALL